MPVAFSGLGVSQRSFYPPWVRGDLGPAWALSWLPTASPTEGRPPGFSPGTAYSIPDDARVPFRFTPSESLSGLGQVNAVGPTPSALLREWAPMAYNLALFISTFGGATPRNHAACGEYRSQFMDLFARAGLESGRDVWRALRREVCAGGGDAAKVARILAGVSGVLALAQRAGLEFQSDALQQIVREIADNVSALFDEIRATRCFATPCQGQGGTGEWGGYILTDEMLLARSGEYIRPPAAPAAKMSTAGKTLLIGGAVVGIGVLAYLAAR
jgi:hypothetical protein